MISKNQSSEFVRNLSSDRYGKRRGNLNQKTGMHRKLKPNTKDIRLCAFTLKNEQAKEFATENRENAGQNCYLKKIKFETTALENMENDQNVANLEQLQHSLALYQNLKKRQLFENLGKNSKCGIPKPLGKLRETPISIQAEIVNQQNSSQIKAVRIKSKTQRGNTPCQLTETALFQDHDQISFLEKKNFYVATQEANSLCKETLKKRLNSGLRGLRS